MCSEQSTQIVGHHDFRSVLKAARANLETRDVRLWGIHVDAERLCKYRRKRIVWAGKALYDWSEKRITIPANESLVTQGWRSDFSDWDEYEGPLPPATGGGFIEARFTVVTQPDPLPDPELKLEEMASVTFASTP